MKLPCISNTQQKMIKYRNLKPELVIRKRWNHGSLRAGLSYGFVGASNKFINHLKDHESINIQYNIKFINV